MDENYGYFSVIYIQYR